MFRDSPTQNQKKLIYFKLFLILKLSKYTFSEDIQIILWEVHLYKIANTDSINLLKVNKV